MCSSTLRHEWLAGLRSSRGPNPAADVAWVVALELARSPWTSGPSPGNDKASREGGLHARGRNRTTDTGIFNPLLYQLSYPGVLLSRSEDRVGSAGPRTNEGSRECWARWHSSSGLRTFVEDVVAGVAMTWRCRRSSMDTQRGGVDRARERHNTPPRSSPRFFPCVAHVLSSRAARLVRSSRSRFHSSGSWAVVLRRPTVEPRPPICRHPRCRS